MAIYVTIEIFKVDFSALSDSTQGSFHVPVSLRLF
jgi:hypothetical protein